MTLIIYSVIVFFLIISALLFDYNKKIKNFSLNKWYLLKNILIENGDFVIVLSALGSFFSTLVLVIITAVSLGMVNKQQEFSFKQFVLANEPSLRVYPRRNNQIEYHNEDPIFFEI